MLPHERVTQRTSTQNVYVPVPQVQEQSAITQFSTSAVEAPQVVDSFPLLDDFAAPTYNQVHQEQIVASVQPHVIFQEIPEVQVADTGTKLLRLPKWFHKSVSHSAPPNKLRCR